MPHAGCGIIGRHRTANSPMRLLLLSLAFVLAGGPAAAQTIYGFGARVGAAHSDLGLDFQGYGPRTGLLASAFAEFNLMNDVSVITELEFAQRGYTFRDRQTSSGEEGSAVTELNYLSVPILFRIRVDATPQVDAYMNVGPRIDILVGHNPAVIRFSNAEERPDPVGHAISANVTGGISGGVGLALRNVLPPELRFDLRYTQGLADLAPEFAQFIRQSSFDFAVAIVF
jgi:hypothetical protein